MITLDRNIVKDKIHACWIGKNIGGTIGAPYECKTEMQNVTGFVTEANVVLPNDDLDLQLVWLRATELAGPRGINPQLLGEWWLRSIPPHWNEYGICKSNMRSGLIPPLSGEYKNPWKHSNGAWIRTEVWACMAPACPEAAMKYARMDACVDHGAGEGTIAAMFVAAMEAAAFVTDDIRELIAIGLSNIPEKSRMAQAVRLICDCYDKGIDWVTARNMLVEDSKDLGWFRAPANVGFVLLGMLYGEGDFKKSILYAVNCGDDTDCTAATVGSLFGIMHGTAGIPEDWRAHIGDKLATVAVDPTTTSIDKLPKTCTELTNRVFDMIPYVLRENDSKVVLGDVNDFPEDDIAAFSSIRSARELAAIPGMSYDIDFIWSRARVVYETDPEINPGETNKVTIIVNNNCFVPRHLNVKWHLPEGWTVKGCRRDYAMDYNHQRTVKINAEITAGDNIEPINRLICEITEPGRLTAGLIPVILLG